MKKTKKLFVFDLDDTLVDTVHDYARPIIDACLFIIEALGNRAPHISKMVAMEQKIDRRLIKTINPKTGRSYSWSMERFPTSLMELYETICQEAKIAPKKDIADTLYHIGLRAFDESRYAKNINPYALSVLNFLREQNDTLILCSKGDSRVQNKKVNALRQVGINHFPIVHIVEEKTQAVFSELSEDFGGYSLYSVGNSYSSDILPALEAGFFGIYIPIETWETIGLMNFILSKVDKTQCLILQNLEDLKTRYGELK